MARKNYPDEFKGDAVALYRDTAGATITVIAAELGVSEATLSAWCKAAGVPIRHRESTSARRHDDYFGPLIVKDRELWTARLANRPRPAAYGSSYREEYAMSGGCT